MAKILFIISPQGFRDEELLHTKEVLDNADFETEIASTKKWTCDGMLGAKVESKFSLGEVKLDNYDAIIYVGGRGTPLIRKEEKAIEIAKEAYKKGKFVCAICWAPTTLAKAGVLKGKKATVWVGHDGEYKTETPQVLEKFGAIYVNQSVVQDGKIITADGPSSAKQFGEKIKEVLS